MTIPLTHYKMNIKNIIAKYKEKLIVKNKSNDIKIINKSIKRGIYSTSQLEATIHYIAKYNVAFKNRTSLIENKLIQAAKDLIEYYPKLTKISTIGSTIIGYDDDQDIRIEFLVDPDLNSSDDEEKEYSFIE